ncbi:MAG: FKBP-type peptidyl-prolyl cis-trans isomerase [Pseudomonadota bacterium]
MPDTLRQWSMLACASALGLSTAALAQTGADARSTSAQDETAERAYHNAQQSYLAGLQAQDGWYTMEGGLRWRYLEYRGIGEQPLPTDTVTVHYAGTFTDGETFDSSYDRGEPATFPLTGLIPAWGMAIPQMRVGETIELAAPANLAYGPRGRGPIPGGATLIFKVELLEIEGR